MSATLLFGLSLLGGGRGQLRAQDHWPPGWHQRDVDSIGHDVAIGIVSQHNAQATVLDDHSAKSREEGTVDFHVGGLAGLLVDFLIRRGLVAYK